MYDSCRPKPEVPSELRDLLARAELSWAKDTAEQLFMQANTEDAKVATDSTAQFFASAKTNVQFTPAGNTTFVATEEDEDFWN